MPLEPEQPEHFLRRGYYDRLVGNGPVTFVENSA